LKKLFFIFFITLPFYINALDLKSCPEAAERGTVFIDINACRYIFFDEIEVDLAVRVDVLPFPIPLSIGAFIAAPRPNLKSFGLRIAYHLDIEIEKLDLYFLYSLDLGFLRNGILAEYGDEKQSARFYDFRAGLRYMFGMFGLYIETDFKLRGLVFGVSVKIN
jgi:hypothetical protein